MKLRAAKDASSLDAQCWISSVTSFSNLQSAEIQKTGLRKSESSGSWNGPDRLALMFILHSSMPEGRLSSEILSLTPYPFHSKEPPLVETTKSVSSITSTSRMDSNYVVDYNNFYIPQNKTFVRPIDLPMIFSLEGWRCLWTATSSLANGYYKWKQIKS